MSRQRPGSARPVTPLWHDRFMVVVTIILALAAVAVLAAIVVVAVGGGGELSVEHPDHPPLALPGRSVGGTDAALLRLPMGLWGYHKQITDDALERFAQELTERDTRIAVLEQELAEARHRLGDDHPHEPSPWRRAVPPSSPAPDSFGSPPALPAPSDPYAVEPYADPHAGAYETDPYAPDPYEAGPPAPGEARMPAEQHEPAERHDEAADGGDREPPKTITDQVVFDPRTITDGDEAPPWPEGGERGDDR